MNKSVMYNQNGEGLLLVDLTTKIKFKPYNFFVQIDTIVILIGFMTFFDMKYPDFENVLCFLSYT